MDTGSLNLYMFTIAQIDEHLIGMGHSSTLNKVRNKEAMYERAASIFSLRMKTLEQMRTMPLTSTIHDDVYNYALPTDFGSIIDLMPQDDRNSWDKAYRTTAGEFDLQKAVRQKTLSIEGSEGVKTARINWRSRQGKVLNNVNGTNDNGLWSAVNGTTNVQQDTITKISAGGSLRFDLAASGDGIKNITMTAVDMTNESTVADVFVWLYFPSVANLSSIIAQWGNDLTTKYWSSVSITTQADGSAFKTGWNLCRFPWSTATQFGVVAPATIDSFELSFVVTGAIANVRMDNIVFSIGRAFDMKYYSKYLIKNAITGIWQSKPTIGSSDDLVLVDNDTLPVFLMELFAAMVHQLEGTDSAFDLNYAQQQLKDLYPILKAQTPSMIKRAAGRITEGPRLRRAGRRRNW